MGKKSKSKQKKNENLLKPLLTELFQKCVNPTGASMPSPKELFLAHKEILDMLANIEKHRGESMISQLPKREQCIEEFCAWAKDQYILFANIEIKSVRNGELGVFAVSEMCKEETFIKIPRAAMMASDCLKESSISSLVENDPMLNSMPNVALALHLLCEVYNEKSNWKPYINILPRHYTNILYFDTDDIENLKGTSMFLQALNTLRSIVRQYAYLSNLFYKHPVAKELGLADKFTFADYKWAVATLMTRQNPIPALNGSLSQVIALIPFLDLCNHKEGPVSIDYNPENRQCECFLMDAVKAGDEILIHYGPRPNTELAVFNGFFYPNNSHDIVKLKLSLSKSDSNYEAKQQLIKRLGLEESFPIGCVPTPIKDSLNAFLLISNSSEEEVKAMLQCDDTELATKLHSGGLVSNETRIKGFKMIKDRCDLCLRVIPDMSDDIKTLYENAQLSDTKMLSLSLKMNEKRLLRDAISFIDGELDALQKSSCQ